MKLFARPCGRSILSHLQREKLPSSFSFSTINLPKDNSNSILKIKSPYDADIKGHIRDPLSLQTSTKKEELDLNISNMIKNLQLHPCDSGSSQVQIGILTEKIMNFTKHLAVNKKDYSSIRGYWAMIHRRRKLMQYLKRTEFEVYARTVKYLRLEREDRKLNNAK